MSANIIKTIIVTTTLFTALFFVVSVALSTQWTQSDGIVAGLLNTMYTRYTFAPDHVVAVWEWRSPTSFSQEDVENITSYCEQKNISVVLLRIDEYIDIYETPRTLEREHALMQFEEHLKMFVRSASAHGVSVYGLAGHPKWSSDSHRYITERLLRFALDYNSRSTEQETLKGLQFDLEPYARDDYDAANAHHYLTGLLETMDRLVRVVQESGQMETFDLGFAIPYWYDDVKDKVPNIAWNGERQLMFLHVAEIIQRVPKSHLAIMAYRTHARGHNGTIEISAPEINHLEKTAGRKILWVGQEVSHTEPSIISFQFWQWANFVRELQYINDAYESNSAFSGIMINNLEALMEQYP